MITEAQAKYLANELLMIQHGSVEDAVLILFDTPPLTDEEASEVEYWIYELANTGEYGD